MRTTRVLVVDDSAFMRHALGKLLAEAEGIEVVGTAGDGLQGLEAAARLHPDVITLDVEMPNLDGLGMLRRLMVESPTRVVMLSSLTTDGAAVTFDALEAGAIDFVAKPSGSLSINVGAVRDDLVGKVRAAAGMPEASFLHYRQAAVARIMRAKQAAGPGTRFAAAASSSAAQQAPARPLVACRRLVVVASSTGGPGALHTLVSGLPAHVGAAIAIVQHMPAGFTTSLATRLDGACAMPVAEARGGDVLAEDRILLAPGGQHLITSSGGRVQLVQLPPVNGVRPAADVTLESVAPAYRDRVLTVVLTGMGSDGCRGAAAVKQHGGAVFAQDRETATIYGMPAAVAEAGLTDRIIPLPRMAAAIAQWGLSDTRDRQLAEAG